MDGTNHHKIDTTNLEGIHSTSQVAKAGIHLILPSVSQNREATTIRLEEGTRRVSFVHICDMFIAFGDG